MSRSNLVQTDRLVLNETERSSTEHEIHHYGDPRAASIETLEIVQKQRGWVPDGVIPVIGEMLRVPASDIEGVITFYSQISRQLVGRHIVRVCDSTVCYIGGHGSVVGEIRKQPGIGLGQTIADGRFILLPVYYLGNCDKAPALMIDDDTHDDVHLDGVAKLLEAYVWLLPPLIRLTA